MFFLKIDTMNILIRNSLLYLLLTTSNCLISALAQERGNNPPPSDQQERLRQINTELDSILITISERLPDVRRIDLIEEQESWRDMVSEECLDSNCEMLATSSRLIWARSVQSGTK